MTRRRHRDEQWPELVEMLSHLRERWPATLGDAQRLFDAAPDVPLAADQIASLASALVRRLGRLLDASGASLVEHLLFTADALASADARWVEPPDVVGVYGLEPWIDCATHIDSLSVDTRQVVFPRTSAPWPRCERDDEVIVLNVWPRFDELDRFDFRRVRQGTLRRNACLDSRNLGDSWRELVPQDEPI